MAAADLREHGADGLMNDSVGDLIERSRLGVDDDHAGARRLGDRHKTGHRIHLKTRADGEKQIGVMGRLLFLFGASRHGHG